MRWRQHATARVLSLVLAAFSISHGHGAGPEPYDLQAVRAELDAISEPLALPDGWLGFSADGTLVCVGDQLFAAKDGAQVTVPRDRLTAAVKRRGAVPPLGDPEPAVEPCTFSLSDRNGRRFVIERRGDRWHATARPEPPEPRIVRRMFPMYGYDRRERLDPKERYFASLKGAELAIRAVGAKVPEALTSDGSDAVQYFLGSDIWESSDSIFSSDGRYFIARRHDARDVPPILIHDPFEQRGREAIEFRYWGRAGDPLPVQTLMIVDAKAQRLRAVEHSGLPDHYHFFVSWSPANDAFVWLRVSRDLKRYELFETRAQDGTSRRLHVERNEERPVKWPGGPQTVRYLPDGSGFLWRSNRSGFFQYHRLSRDGDVLYQITQGAFDVGDVLKIDASDNRLYYFGAGDPSRPFDRRLLWVPLDQANAAPAVLTAEPGQHDVVLAHDGQQLLDVHSQAARLPTAVLRDRQGRVMRTLWEPKLPPSRPKWPAPIEFEVPVGKGKPTALGLLFRPPGFDPEQCYPVIERIYGAVSLAATPRGYPGFGDDGPFGDYRKVIPMLAARGFVVVTVDAPGVMGRGEQLENARYGRWPEGLISDHRAVLEALAERYRWMDLDRTGVAGNSWGGYSAVLAGLEAPDLYRAVSASVPQTSLTDHASWIEFKLGLKTNNPGAYAAGELADRMQNWQPFLQIIAGTADVNVPVTNSYRLLDALADAGKPYDLVLFPGTNHLHQGRGDRYSYAIAAMRGFFEAKLGGPQADCGSG